MTEGTAMNPQAEHAIREIAYGLWHKEGSPDGQDKFFWDRAVLIHQASLKPPMKTPLQQQDGKDKEVEQAAAESFPASDPPSFTPEGGVQTEGEAR